MRKEVPGASVDKQRWRLLKLLEDWLETPMIVLGFVWLALLIIELVFGQSGLLATAGRVIWGVFILDFLLRFTLAPKKRLFLKRNVLTLFALLLPALRALRLIRMLRILQAGRGITFVRILTSTNRGITALRRSMQRRGVGYVLLLTLLVMLIGGAGMYAFERSRQGFESFAEALWWTAMLLAGLGATAWPESPEGRLLCFLLGLYGLAVFGYLTATLASFFVDRDADDDGSAVASQAAVRELQREIRALRDQLDKQRAP